MQHMVRVRESRAADDPNPVPSIVAWDAVFACIDAELAALLAAERQRVVGVMQDELRMVKDDDPNHDGGTEQCSDCVEFAYYNRVAARLTGGDQG
jgi:hypothetical protein